VIGMSYTEMRHICDGFLQRILGDFDLVAVVRGGLTPAHYIGRRLGKEILFFHPATCVLTSSSGMVNLDHQHRPFVLVEDVISLGRTLDVVRQAFNGRSWHFFALVCDAGSCSQLSANVTAGIICNEWVCFPWEDPAKILEGEREMFRSGQNEYANR